MTYLGHRAFEGGANTRIIPTKDTFRHYGNAKAVIGILIYDLANFGFDFKNGILTVDAMVGYNADIVT